MDGAIISMPLRFPGQYYDADTKLHYNYHRYYDPSTGRYISSDPIGLAGGMNTYGYVSGNPLMHTDSNGLCPCGDPNQLIDNARLDPRDWSKDADRTDINSGFESGTYKCNLFADTSFEESGFNLPNIGGSWLSSLLGRYPPGARNLSDANYEVPGWPVVSDKPQKGDLIANQGHVGIFTENGKTISAAPKGKIENDWGFRKNQVPVIRRCSCN